MSARKTAAPRIDFVKMARLDSPAKLRARLEALGLELPVDDEVVAGPGAPLAQPLRLELPRGPAAAGNRFAVLPMEGWDATPDGRPTERVERRWRRFGASGAKLVWGGEAVAVVPEGRANPNQLRIAPETAKDLAQLRCALVEAHEEAHGRSDDLVVGLQLTHSGRFARPGGAPRPRVAHRDAWLDARVGGIPDEALLGDAELDALVARFIEAAALAADAGFHFVDVKHCHGYLGHELLASVDRPGPYGGDLDGRSRLLRRVAQGIRREVPALGVGVRLSLFDLRPFRPGESGRGEPEPDAAADTAACRYRFGGTEDGLAPDLTETDALLARFRDWGIGLVCTTAGSPYANPHVQRPASQPPSDGYLPPEDPLVGVARQLAAAAELKRRHPRLVTVGSALSYLQEWVPHVAQALVSEGWVDAVGLGRMMLSYPELPADVLAGRPLRTRALCRTFSDCTTAPRNGLPSGCYPLDPAYRESPEHERLKERKRGPGRAGSAKSTPSA